MSNVENTPQEAATDKTPRGREELLSIRFLELQRWMMLQRIGLKLAEQAPEDDIDAFVEDVELSTLEQYHTDKEQEGTDLSDEAFAEILELRIKRLSKVLELFGYKTRGPQPSKVEDGALSAR